MKQGEDKQGKQEITNLQMIASKLYFVFCGNEQTNPVINRSIVSNTYQQIVQILHFTLLYTIYGQTNNASYDTVQTILSILIIVVCIVPRVASKHYTFLFTLIVVTVITLASAGSITILIIDYGIFTNYCNTLYSYSLKNKSFHYKAEDLCQSITRLYYAQLAFSCLIQIIRAIYIYLVFKAYQTSKRINEEQQSNRRREEKFNEKNKKNKKIFDVNRKI